jgi:hypothetical protein
MECSFFFYHFAKEYPSCFRYLLHWAANIQTSDVPGSGPEMESLVPETTDDRDGGLGASKSTSRMAIIAAREPPNHLYTARIALLTRSVR